MLPPELDKAKEEYRQLKRNLEVKRRKLKRIYDKYYFVECIVNPEIDDIELQQHVGDLFKDLGYVTLHPENNDEFDVILATNNGHIGIEVKNDNHVRENELFQALKYGMRYKERNATDIFSLVVWNNTKSNHSFDGNRIKDADLNHYGLITTQELLKGYLKVKTNRISIDLFNSLLVQKGIVKYSNSKIK